MKKKLLAITALPLGFTLALLWHGAASAIDLCPAAGNPQAMQQKAEQLVLLIPETSDDNRQQKDDFLRSLASTRAASGDLARSEQLIRAISASSTRGFALAELAATADAQGSADLATSLFEEALQLVQPFSSNKHVDPYLNPTATPYERIRQQWGEVGFVRGIERIEGIIARSNRNDLSITAQEQVKERIASAEILIANGLTELAAQRLKEARQDLRKISSELSPVAEFHVRAAEIEMKLNGHDTAIAHVEATRRPSERLLVLATLASGLASQGKDATPALIRIQSQLDQVSEVIWYRGKDRKNHLVLRDVAKVQEELGDPDGALATLEKTHAVLAQLQDNLEKIDFQTDFFIFLSQFLKRWQDRATPLPPKTDLVFAELADSFEGQFKPERICTDFDGPAWSTCRDAAALALAHRAATRSIDDAIESSYQFARGKRSGDTHREIAQKAVEHTARLFSPEKSLALWKQFSDLDVRVDTPKEAIAEILASSPANDISGIAEKYGLSILIDAFPVAIERLLADSNLEQARVFTSAIQREIQAVQHPRSKTSYQLQLIPALAASGQQDKALSLWGASIEWIRQERLKSLRSGAGADPALVDAALTLGKVQQLLELPNAKHEDYATRTILHRLFEQFPTQENLSIRQHLPAIEALIALNPQYDFTRGLIRLLLASQEFNHAMRVIDELSGYQKTAHIKPLLIALADSAKFDLAQQQWDQSEDKYQLREAGLHLAGAYLRAGKPRAANKLINEIDASRKLTLEEQVDLATSASRSGNRNAVARRFAEIRQHVSQLSSYENNDNRAALQLVRLASDLIERQESKFAALAFDEALALNGQHLSRYDVYDQLLDEILTTEALHLIARGKLKEAERHIHQIETEHRKTEVLARLEKEHFGQKNGYIGHRIADLGKQIDLNIDLAGTSWREGASDTAYRYISEGLALGLANRCPYAVFRVLPEYGRIGRVQELIAWLSHLEVPPAIWQRALGRAALAQIEEKDLAGANATFRIALDMLETNRLPKPEAWIGQLVAETYEETAALPQGKRSCTSISTTVSSSSPEFVGLMTLLKVAGNLERPEAEIDELLHASEKIIENTDDPNGKEILRAHYLVNLGHTGRTEAICTLISSLPDETTITWALAEAATMAGSADPYPY